MSQTKTFCRVARDFRHHRRGEAGRNSLKPAQFLQNWITHQHDVENDDLDVAPMHDKSHRKSQSERPPIMNPPAPPFFSPAESNAFLADHIGLLRRSYRQLTGRDLIDPGLSDRAAALVLFEAPFALLSHDTQADPILTYGNRMVLRLFGLTWEQLTAMPSRYTAEAPNREERARLLRTVADCGYIDDYCGVRVAASGRRFMIENACVWNLVDAGGGYQGQAATFAQWRSLEPGGD